MSKESYPTGVENHGKSLRIWFILKVSVSGENLGVPDTAKTGRWQGNCERQFVSLSAWGPLTMRRNSPIRQTRKTFGIGKKDITVKDLSEKMA